MSNILIVGGSKGIGAALLSEIVAQENCINISRTAPSFSHPNLVHHALDVVQDELPTLENLRAIVYCPGTITLKPVASLKEADLLNDYQINVIGAFKVVKQYYRQLSKQTNASIVLFSTVAVAQGMPFHSSIAAAKAGVEGLMRSLAAEFAPKIRVNCIAPTITQTSLAAGILRNEAAIEKIKERHPLKNILAPSDVASLAAYLISGAAKNITGQVFNIDGGMSSLKI